MGLLQLLFGPKIDFKELVEKGALIIDVRSTGEFRSGTVKGARNIPLDQLKTKLPELKKAAKPVITVCRSGSRSGMGKSILSAAGIEAYNGGPWDSLQKKINK